MSTCLNADNAPLDQIGDYQTAPTWIWSIIRYEAISSSKFISRECITLAEASGLVSK